MWTKSASNPILPLGGPGAFDELEASNPMVVHDGTQFVMWYAAVDANDIQTTGRAVSPDGIAWTKTGMVLDVGPAGSFDDLEISDPGITRANGLHYDYYTAVDSSTFVDPEGSRSVGLAVSIDGVTWGKLGQVLTRNPVTSAFDSLRVGNAEPERFNGQFYVWYGAKSARSGSRRRRAASRWPARARCSHRPRRGRERSRRTRRW